MLRCLSLCVRYPIDLSPGEEVGAAGCITCYQEQYH